MAAQRWGLGVRRTLFDAVLVEALRGEPRATLMEGVRATGLLRDPSGAVAGRGHLGGACARHGGRRRRRAALADCARPPAGRAPTRPGGRYGLAGHWAVDVRDLDGITVTFADQQEWYQAPVGPDLLLVSTLERSPAHRRHGP